MTVSRRPQLLSMIRTRRKRDQRRSDSEGSDSEGLGGSRQRGDGGEIEIRTAARSSTKAIQSHAALHGSLAGLTSRPGWKHDPAETPTLAPSANKRINAMNEPSVEFDRSEEEILTYNINIPDEAVEAAACAGSGNATAFTVAMCTGGIECPF
jgi:hypothetical protein